MDGTEGRHTLNIYKYKSLSVARNVYVALTSVHIM